MRQELRSGRQGFTIVELLIVIVVIGILAAIVIVAFNGVQNRANDVAVQSDLKSLAKLLEQHKAVNEQYPASMLNVAGAKATYSAYGPGYNNGSADYNLIYCRVPSGVDAAFALVAQSKSGKSFKYTSQSGTVDVHPQAMATGNTTCSNAGMNPLTPGFGVQWQKQGTTPGWII